MRWQQKLRLRLRSLFRKSQVERELNDEIQFHLQSQIDEYVERGMDTEEARTAALRSLGGSERVKEHCRDMRRVNFIEDFLQDLRFGFRMLRRTPGFSLLVILCLTLGIGANAVVFSWIEGILLRPFPSVAHQDRLVAVVSTKARNSGASDSEYGDSSWQDWLDFERNCTLFDAFIADKIMGTTLSIGERAEQVAGSVVSSNYFDALGVHPLLGRGFQPGEDSGRNAHPVTVISYWMWQQRFGGDPNIIGRVQRLNGMPHTIVGVAPEGFYGTFVGRPIQFWVPASMQETFVPGGYQLEDRAGLWIEGFARLKPGVTLEQGQAEISAVAKRLENEHLATNRGRGVKLFPLWKAPFNQAGNLFPTLEIALGVVFFVLLIACANVGNLLLARSIARRHEMTVRLAVGARRTRLLRQLVTEGFILSTCAAGGGLLLAYCCRNLLVVFFPSYGGSVAHLQGGLDWRVLAFDAAVCLIATLLFDLVPAIQTSNIDLAGSLKSESGSVFGSRGKLRLRSSLVLVQMSLSFILLVGAVLLMESMQRIRTANPGFSTENVLTTGLDLVAAGYDAQRAKNFQDALFERVQALPGVESAALARVRPFSYNPYSSAPIAVHGYQRAPDEQPAAEYNEVSPAYFATLGIPLLSGREFTSADNETGAPVAMVNQEMVARYWRGEDPIGTRLQVKGRWMRVVGVARTAKYETFSEAPKSFFYVPLRQNFSIRASLNVRTQQDPKALAPALARIVRGLDANVAPGEIITMRKSIDLTALSSQQVAVSLLSIFGGLALLLAAVGLYAVMSYSVSQSSRELGLRMALGAAPSDLLRSVMSHGLSLTAAGVVIGAGAALGLTRLAGNLLYKMSPRDPVAFALAFGVLMIISIAASLLPAWRAAQTDPVQALRD